MDGNTSYCLLTWNCLLALCFPECQHCCYSLDTWSREVYDKPVRRVAWEKTNTNNGRTVLCGVSVFQIFVESLLCSSDMKNILLAGKMMERSAAEGREPDYSMPDSDHNLTTEKVKYERAIQLVLQAAREYFDSSTNLTDISMDLARSGLNISTWVVWLEHLMFVFLSWTRAPFSPDLDLLDLRIFLFYCYPFNISKEAELSFLSCCLSWQAGSIPCLYKY